MAKGTTTTQDQTDKSQTNPWDPAQGNLIGILNKLGGVSTDLTAPQSGAIANIENRAQGAPDFSLPTQGILKQYFAGGMPNQSGTVTDAYGDLKSRLSPTANGANLDPTTAPGMASTLDTVRNDVQNSVRSQFAGAGRPAGTNADVAQAEARGIAQAEAPILTGQYNENVRNQLGAAGTLYGAGTTTAGTVTGMNQAELANKAQGINLAGAYPTIANQNDQTVLQAESARTGIPMGLLQQLTAMTGGIAGLGGQSTGTRQGTTNQQQDPLTTALGVGIGGVGMLSKIGFL